MQRAEKLGPICTINTETNRSQFDKVVSHKSREDTCSGDDKMMKEADSFRNLLLAE